MSGLRTSGPGAPSLPLVRRTRAGRAADARRSRSARRRPRAARRGNGDEGEPRGNDGGDARRAPLRISSRAVRPGARRLPRHSLRRARRFDPRARASRLRRPVPPSRRLAPLVASPRARRGTPRAARSRRGAERTGVRRAAPARLAAPCAGARRRAFARPLRGGVRGARNDASGARRACGRPRSLDLPAFVPGRPASSFLGRLRAPSSGARGPRVRPARRGPAPARAVGAPRYGIRAERAFWRSEGARQKARRSAANLSRNAVSAPFGPSLNAAHVAPRGSRGESWRER